MEGVLTQPTFKSRFTKRSTRPLCRTKCIERLKSYKDGPIIACTSPRGIDEDGPLPLRLPYCTDLARRKPM